MYLEVVIEALIFSLILEWGGWPLERLNMDRIAVAEPKAMASVLASSFSVVQAMANLILSAPKYVMHLNTL